MSHYIQTHTVILTN